MRFKRPEMGVEFITLDPLLQLIICDVNKWGLDHGEEPTWTCFKRTAEEQMELYEMEIQRLIDQGMALDVAQKLSVSKKVSVHMFDRGADFRPFKNNNLNLLIEEYINSKYPYGDGVHKTLLFHEGTANHGHLQVKA